MVSNNELKLLKNLSQKKYRDKENAYLIEGLHGVEEAIKSAPELIEYILYSEGMSRPSTDRIKTYELPSHKLDKVSVLKTSPGVVAKMHKPQTTALPDIQGLVFYLDHISNPGNLGTIIRTTDWFGGGMLLLSEGCSDVYNPKTVQASMGSIHRVRCYIETHSYSLTEQAQKCAVLAADMQGHHYRDTQIQVPTIIALGSESHGVSEAVLAHSSDKISIPASGQAESLNVAITHGILTAHFTA